MARHTVNLSYCISFEMFGSAPDLFGPIESETSESPSNTTYLKLQRVDVSSACNPIVSASAVDGDDDV